MPKSLSVEVAKIMTSELGDMGPFIIKKQCKDLDIDPDNIPASSLPALANALSGSMKLFGTDKAKNLYNKILKLKDLEKMVDGEADTTQKLDDLLHLASMGSNAGDWGAAGKYYDEALALSIELGEKEKEARIHRSIAGHVLRSGDYKSADKHLKESLAIAKELDNQKEMVETLRGLGNAHWRKGEYENALGYLDDALHRAQKLKDDEAVAHVYMAMANVYDEKGDYDTGIGYAKQSLEFFEKAGKMQNVATVLNNIGVAYARMENYAESVKYYERCIKVSQDANYVLMNAWAMFNAGEDYAKLGKFDISIEYCENSLAVFKKMKDKLGMSGALMSFAIAYKLKEDYAKSLDHFNKTIKLREELGMPYRLADACYECGLMLVKKGDKKSARQYLDRALKIFTEIRSAKMAERTVKAIESLK